MSCPFESIFPLYPFILAAIYQQASSTILHSTASSFHMARSIWTLPTHMFNSFVAHHTSLEFLFLPVHSKHWREATNFGWGCTCFFIFF